MIPVTLSKQALKLICLEHQIHEDQILDMPLFPYTYRLVNMKHSIDHV